ncbi:MAG: hypothetical protein WDO15_11295 [Bacteroidota bacterium]
MELNQLKTFEDACEVEGLDAGKIIPDFANYPERDRKAMIAHAKLVIIVRAANRIANNGIEWIADFDNRDQVKYEVWLEKRGSSGFRFDVYVSRGSDSYVGSRLALKSRELATYAGTQFTKIFEQFMIIN